MSKRPYQHLPPLEHRPDGSPYQFNTPQKAELPTQEALPSFCLHAPFPAHPKRERGRFHVRQTGAGPVWGLAVLLCGGGLPPVLALLRHGLRGPGGGAERGHPPPARPAGQFL